VILGTTQPRIGCVGHVAHALVRNVT
jgi:hypothetical protein